MTIKKTIKNEITDHSTKVNHNKQDKEQKLLDHMINIYEIMERDACLYNQRAEKAAVELASNMEPKNAEEQEKKDKAYRVFKIWESAKSTKFEDARLLREAINFHKDH